MLPPAGEAPSAGWALCGSDASGQRDALLVMDFSFDILNDVTGLDLKDWPYQSGSSQRFTSLPGCLIEEKG